MNRRRGPAAAAGGGVAAAARIRAVVAAIPPGRVATYGQVAALAGLPGRARLVGQALGGLPAGDRLPWHRVLAAGGRLALGKGTVPGQQQRRRLRREGVVFRGDRVDLDVSRWAPDLDELLWGPPPAGGEGGP